MTDKKDAFLAISTPQELANLLDISYSKYIIYYLYRAPLEHLYFKFNIPKRSGDTREITAPKSGLKLIQKKLPKSCCY